MTRMPTAPLLTALLLLYSLESASSFLPITPDSNYHSSLNQVLNFHCGATSPSLSLPMATMSDSDDEEEGQSSTRIIDQENAALLQAKLAVLEDVVIQLNVSQCEDQKEIQSLKSQVVELEASLSKQQRKYQTAVASHQKELQMKQTEWEDRCNALTKQLNEKEANWKEEQLALVADLEKKETEWMEEMRRQKMSHKTEIQGLEETISRRFQQEQDTLKQELLKDTTDRKLEWKESLEIASAAVTATEVREQALQVKLEELETRYHEEAASYKTELGHLRNDWKKENLRLEKEVISLSTELVETKASRDKETTILLDHLEVQNSKLEEDLKLAREQVKFQKIQFSTQQQVAKEQWREQRDKERKFYTEAIRLLQQESQSKPGFWKRVFRSFFGRGSAKAGRSSQIAP